MNRYPRSRWQAWCQSSNVVKIFMWIKVVFTQIIFFRSVESAICPCRFVSKPSWLFVFVFLSGQWWWTRRRRKNDEAWKRKKQWRQLCCSWTGRRVLSCFLSSSSFSSPVIRWFIVVVFLLFTTIPIPISFIHYQLLWTLSWTTFTYISLVSYHMTWLGYSKAVGYFVFCGQNE